MNDFFRNFLISVLIAYLKELAEKQGRAHLFTDISASDVDYAFSNFSNEEVKAFLDNIRTLVHSRDKG